MLLWRSDGRLRGLGNPSRRGRTRAPHLLGFKPSAARVKVTSPMHIYSGVGASTGGGRHAAAAQQATVVQEGGLLERR